MVRAPDPSGPKAVAVTLTPAGHAVIERSVDAVLGREAELVDGLSDDERSALVSLLDKLSHHVAGALGHPPRASADSPAAR